MFISLLAGQNFPPAGQISLQCGMFSLLYFFFSPPNHKISWQGASRFACFSRSDREQIIGRMSTPVREAFSYGIRHGIRHIHCDSMMYDLMLH